MAGEITITEKKKICLKYNTWMVSEFNHIFHRLKESDKFKRIGKIYYKEKTKLYHGLDSIKSIIEGSDDFEEVLVRLLKSMDII